MFELAKFLGGYLAILAVPGPNLLAIVGMVTSNGLRGASPLCLGIALGAGALSIGLLCVAELAQAWRVAGRFLGPVLLIVVAVLIVRQKSPERGEVSQRKVGIAAFCVGFVNAVTNPVTAAYFLGQFSGPLHGQGVMLVLIPTVVSMTAMAFFMSLSSLLARPAFSGRLSAWDVPIRIGAAHLLIFMSGLSAARALVEVGWQPFGQALAITLVFTSGVTLGFVLGRMLGGEDRLRRKAGSSPQEQAIM